MCILCVVAVFINLQLIDKFFVTGNAASADLAGHNANGEAIASLYFFSMLVAFVGSLLMGLVAKLPLCQIPSLGLSSLLISALGIGSGLTYMNLLAVSLVGGAVTTVIAAVPPVRKFLFKAIPAGVKKAAPAAVGILMVFVMLQMTGLVQVSQNSIVDADAEEEEIVSVDTSITIYGTGDSITEERWNKAEGESVQSAVEGFDLFDFAAYNTKDGKKSDSYYPLLQTCMICAVAAFGFYLLLRKGKRPVTRSLLLATGLFWVLFLCQKIFYVYKGEFGYELDALWGRLWMVGSEDAQHTHLAMIMTNFAPFRVLSEGFDFSAYTEAGGNGVTFMIYGVLTYLGAQMAFLQAAGIEEENEGKATLANGIINIAAPLVGMSPVSVTPVSEAGKRDGAKSGLASVVAAIGFLVSAFVWIVPFFFATTTHYDIEFNMYGHYGEVLQYLTETSFIVADAVIALVGLLLIAKTVRAGFEGERSGGGSGDGCGDLLYRKPGVRPGGGHRGACAVKHF